MTFRDRLIAEGLGTAFLLAIVVGSGIMAERLSGGNAAIALLANSLATGAGLAALILVCGSVSAHFNPVVTLTLATRGELAWRDVAPYIVVQIVGAIVGVWAAHGMFNLPLWEVSSHVRSGWNLCWSEFVATLGLLLTIIQCSKHRPSAIPFAVAAYITAAYWFTASTSFANPAVTLARSLTDTYCGIRPVDISGFLIGQIAAVATVWIASNRMRR